MMGKDRVDGSFVGLVPAVEGTIIEFKRVVSLEVSTSRGEDAGSCAFFDEER